MTERHPKAISEDRSVTDQWLSRFHMDSMLSILKLFYWLGLFQRNRQGWFTFAKACYNKLITAFPGEHSTLLRFCFRHLCAAMNLSDSRCETGLTLIPSMTAFQVASVHKSDKACRAHAMLGTVISFLFICSFLHAS